MNTPSLFDKLAEDFRYQEGLNACMNCGVCTAICPAAEIYNYDPRMVIDLVQSKNEEALKELLKSETIWYCGECMSCKTRCPRNNTVGLLIMALRRLSQLEGYFVESEKGRQQYALNKVIGGNILKYGYCLHPTSVVPELHPEQGPVWKWVYNNMGDVYQRLGANLDGDGPGVLRKIDNEAMAELHAIFEITGGMEFRQQIETASLQKASEMGIMLPTEDEDSYLMRVYTDNNQTHNI